MINDCRHRNKLVRDGISQGGRQIGALDPSCAPVDERGLADLLSFVSRFAAQVNYYDLDNRQDGDWTAFFRDDSASLLANFTAFDPKKVRLKFQDAVNHIAAGGAQVRQQIRIQFDLLITLLAEVEKWVRRTDPGLKVHNDLDNEISAGFSRELLNLSGYYKKAIAINLINSPSSPNLLEKQNFGPEWFRYEKATGSPYEKWENYYASIPPSDVFNPSGSLKKMGLYSQVFLKKALDNILSGYARLLLNTDLYLEDILVNYPSHEPHMGLLISFLQLFKFAQDQINTLTRRHLDFYFLDVLGLKPHDPVSDQAFILFELAKGINSLKVARDTALSAGKDKIKQEILFCTSKESVHNTASIKEIKSIYIDKRNDFRVYASPVANSADGSGAKFKETPGTWKPFGETQDTGSGILTMPNASIGFMVASETLALSEGERDIRLDITCDLSASDLKEDLKNGAVKVYFSGEEEWVEYTPTILLNSEPDSQTHTNHLIFEEGFIHLLIKVDGDKGPIVTHDPKIHDSRFDQKLPVIYLEAVHDKPCYIYNLLKNVRIEQIDIAVTSHESKVLLLQNDESMIDPSKPFSPFGTVPRVGSSFVIGSKEVMNKKLTKLELHGKWNEFPKKDGIAAHYSNYDTLVTYDIFEVTPKILKNGTWEKEGSELTLFKGDTDDTFDLVFHDDENAPIGDAVLTTFPEKYDMNASTGFIKLELTDNEGFAFGHKEFPKVYAEQAIKQSIKLKLATIETLDLPNKPYTPVLKDFYISYEAKGNIAFGSTVKDKDNDGTFCQVHPFGYRELKAATASEDLYLMPRFGHEGKGSVIWHNGEILIGIDKLTPPASLELLFKVAEGSEDPELPSQSIDWFYLSNEEWRQFERSEIVADNTRYLTTSAILSLAIPELKSLQTSQLTTGLLWIKGAAENNTDAVCKIIAIHPNASLTEFKDQNNDPSRTASALKAGSIAKLKLKNPLVKSISQPYASFGGKPGESSSDFYLRSSERLRHKARGISIWDYEHIILQEFPDLYKVKCINHTSYGYYEDLEAEMDSEFAPGYVTLILMPKTFNQNAINPYEPRVTKADIVRVEELIKKRIPLFAARKLKILNPLYEQIQLDFEVEFHEKYSDRGFYEKQLNDDIKKHLSPWAYTEGKEISLGGRVYKSSLIDFIEELYYVDYLKDVKMHQYVDRLLARSNIQTALPSTARSAFVTFNQPEGGPEHLIREIS